LIIAIFSKISIIFLYRFTIKYLCSILKYIQGHRFHNILCSITVKYIKEGANKITKYSLLQSIDLRSFTNSVLDHKSRCVFHHSLATSSSIQCNYIIISFDFKINDFYKIFNVFKIKIFPEAE